jgi:[ribosomal protein S5]-alanine N-acetyltransferase
MVTHRVYFREPNESDCAALLDLHQHSQDFHAPWSYLPQTLKGCQQYIQRCHQDNFAGFLICHAQTQQIVGVVNLSQIFYGAFQNAYLGYYAHVDYAGQGLMKAGLRLVINHAFFTLNLHRLEANIQPENRRSLGLISSLGFRKEGYSPRYLKIGNEWRDHERWALTVEDWTAQPSQDL